MKTNMTIVLVAIKMIILNKNKINYIDDTAMLLLNMDMKIMKKKLVIMTI